MTLRKVVKVVRAKQGTVRRAYWVKAEQTRTRPLYHGSPVGGLTQLKPSPSQVLGGKKAVFATHSRAAALSFIGKWDDSVLEHGQHGRKIYIRERHKGAFDRVFKGQSGTLYHVSRQGFERHKSLASYERIHSHHVPVLKAEHIQDVWKALEKSNAVLARHGQKFEWER